MDAKLQLRVQRYGWDAAAPVYDNAWRERLVHVQRALIDACDLKPGQRVIETAAGSGLVTFPIAEAVAPGGQVVATDLSGDMAAMGMENAERLGFESVTFERMNVESITHEDDSFDRAICSLGLMYTPDPVAALREMTRVVRPGGRVAVLVWGERKKCGWADLFPIVDARVKSEVCPLFFGLGVPQALKSAMTDAGLREIEEHRLSQTQHFRNRDELLEAYIDGGAVALASKRFDESTRRGVDDEFLASVARYRNGSGYSIPVEFVLAVGVV